MNYHCSHCHKRIPTGMAAIRTIMFQRVTFHRDCPHTITKPKAYDLAV